ncbi:CAPA peptides [Atheta coriaria]|uniref:CAPA peptides n=1 Tax=Dalotia coriaria TaxID=877792 RepID=UPI0031F3D2CA
MNKFVAHSLQMYCVLILFVVVCHAGDMNEPKRYSNDQGLIAFPRVGRREAALKLAKLRNELFAFPRIGRSQPLAMGIKRDGSTKTMNTGLWFGPRLGRVQKRNLYAFTPDLEDYYNAAGDVKPVVHYTPRVGTIGHDSDEDLDIGQPLLEDS